jgi:UDP-N-acetylmuramate dehydrogenase
MFRNPPGDFAGRLIEAAASRAGASATRRSPTVTRISSSITAARAADVKQLMDAARAEVKVRFGVELVPEVRFLGEW